jgi:DNA-binding ferritin-like protein (Dps family)
MIYIIISRRKKLPQNFREVFKSIIFDNFAQITSSLQTLRALYEILEFLLKGASYAKK